ncbi:MAG: beta-lactamase family protein [Defluviitaleaceae bacterium]|nr:beta-lactamase family protein [Defluviitaleaceae bacterium]
MSRIAKIIGSQKHYDGVTLEMRMEECRTGAVSIALIENYEICEVYSHGVKRRGGADRVTTDTLFQAASISKPIFAVAVMCLAERGVLDIDADVFDYIIGYEVPTYDNQKHKITLRQILSHNAGLNIHGFAGYQHGQEVPTIEQILHGALPSNHLKLRLIKKPETGFQYSGGGYVLAQKIVADVCKNDFCELMRDLIFTPLCMSKSTFFQPLPKDRLHEIAFGYDDHNLEIPGGYDIMPELSAAGLWTTPSDLARLGVEMMNALRGKGVYLSQQTAQLMVMKAYENTPYGIGFKVGEGEKGLIFGHSGYNDGFISNMTFCPNDGSGIVVMINSNIGGGITDEVTSAFKEIYGW